MSTSKVTLAKWLPIAVAATLVLGVAYVFVQQGYRQNANDPQVMVAHDVARGIEAGQTPDQLVSNETVDPSVSLAPFVIVFDAGAEPTVSSGRLSGAMPVPPHGVLDASRASGENRVTWQPRAGVRIAAVIVPVKGGAGGYVLAGRSLRLVEERIDTLTLSAALAWFATMVATLLAVAAGEWMTRP